MASGPKLTWAGKIFIILFIAACLGGAYYLFTKWRSQPQPVQAPSPQQPTATKRQKAVEIGIAYGTEKKRWLEWAVKEFEKTPEGASIAVNLIPMGSLEGAQAILGGDERIHVWSPASALYKDVFVQEWKVKYNTNPLLTDEDLALTPMAFVMWEERYRAFVDKYGELSFKTISEALKERGGWDAIAGKPEWGFFKFGHTNPNQSNSGLMTLVLMAYDYHGICKDLKLKQIVDTGFQDWMQTFEHGVSGLIHSTGTMMRDMVLKGPSTYDAVIVYENVAIDYLKSAEGRWGRLQVVYPEKNAWNENPYYVINADWSTEDHRTAAKTLMEFLLSKPIQQQSLVHGFRPGDPTVPIKFPDSPFIKYEKFGIHVDLQSVCEPPKAEVLNNLLASWIRYQGKR